MGSWLQALQGVQGGFSSPPCGMPWGTVLLLHAETLLLTAAAGELVLPKE